MLKRDILFVPGAWWFFCRRHWCI